MDVNIQVCEELVLVCVSGMCVKYWYLWFFTFQYILVTVIVGINIPVHVGGGGGTCICGDNISLCVGTSVDVLCFYCTSVLYTCVY